VTLAEAADLAEVKPPDLAELDDALSTLATLDPRRAAVVELRFLGGLTLEETAARLGISPETAGRDWSRAKTWLYEELVRRCPEESVGVASVPPEDEASELAGHLLGAYRLLGRIARGGMGDVYLARRDDGQFDRQVAVKVLRPELLGTEAQVRFHAERKTLAVLEHPGIARLYDGGTTPDGRPFLVMERVEGLPIDEYADRHGLAIEARLDLMLAVCAAVDFAHGKRVVHRDLKPENILVDARGEPKLLDFGVAEPLAEELSRRRPGGLGRAPWMTPSYASPEQVRGEPATTASDVYALGVVLYELLTGRSPYPDATTRAEAEAAIHDEIPRRPSEIVLGGGGASGPAVDARTPRLGSLRTWSRRLRGDLDAIVLKALEKQPRLRYSTAASLADDLKSFLRGRSVRARNGSGG
jgi:serine/threonine protein kinase